MTKDFLKIEQELNTIYRMNNIVHELSKGVENESLMSSLLGINQVINQQLELIANKLKD